MIAYPAQESHMCVYTDMYANRSAYPLITIMIFFIDKNYFSPRPPGVNAICFEMLHQLLEFGVDAGFCGC